MEAITYTTARENLATTMDRVCADGAPVTITRSGKRPAVVLLSLEEYEQLAETAHLLRSPANARRLMVSVESLARGKGKVRPLDLSGP